MTEITREELVEVLKLFDDPDYIPERIAQGFDAGRIKYLCTLALKSLEQPTPSQDTVEAVLFDQVREIIKRTAFPGDLRYSFTEATQKVFDTIAAYEARRK